MGNKTYKCPVCRLVAPKLYDVDGKQMCRECLPAPCECSRCGNVPDPDPLTYYRLQYLCWECLMKVKDPLPKYYITRKNTEEYVWYAEETTQHDMADTIPNMDEKPETKDPDENLIYINKDQKEEEQDV